MLLQKVKFDVLGIKESNFMSKIRDEDMIPGNKFFRKQRPVENGEGELCETFWQH